MKTVLLVGTIGIVAAATTVAGLCVVVWTLARGVENW